MDKKMRGKKGEESGLAHFIEKVGLFDSPL